MTYTHTQAPPIPKHRPQEPKKYPTLSIKKVCAMIEERCGSAASPSATAGSAATTPSSCPRPCRS